MKQENNRLDNKHHGLRRGIHIFIMAMLLIGIMTVPCLATGTTSTTAENNEVITAINNLSDFIFGLIRAIGLILLGFGVLQVGMSISSHDPTQRSQGFLYLAGGLIITFTKEILTLITGGAV